MKIFIILSCVVAVVLGKYIDSETKLPSSLKICHLNDPQRDECIRSSMEHFLSALHEKPETIDFPQVEPFKYDSVTFTYNNPNFVQGSNTIRNQRTYGISKVKVLKVKSEFKNDEMTLIVSNHFPKLFSTGSYKSNMTLGIFKIEAKGQFNVSLIDVLAKWTIKGKLQKINGEDFMVVNSFDVLPEPKEVKISATGLFPDEELNKFANDFFNEHWQVFYREMIPETRKQWEPLFRNIVNQFFSQIPFKYLLKKD